MIRITLGSKHALGMHALMSSLYLLQKCDLNKITIYSNEQINHLLANNLNIKICQQGLVESLVSALSDMKSEDILLNLPAEKGDFLYQGSNFLGHTDYFRHHFKNINLAMCFSSKQANMLLLTDHIPLKKVSESLSQLLIVEKTTIALKGFKTINKNIKKVVYFGVNPHAGEKGLLGHEENSIFAQAISILEKQLPHIQFSIAAADGYFLRQHFSNETLIISPYHDQGLSLFKTTQSMIGVHYTFGLPFIRISPIHGTVNDLKNLYNYNSNGIISAILVALKFNK